jgi:hypothetical protein
MNRGRGEERGGEERGGKEMDGCALTVSVAVGCFTFDALSRLSDDDANPFPRTGHCFVCHTALHHIKQCPVKGLL